MSSTRLQWRILRIVVVALAAFTTGCQARDRWTGQFAFGFDVDVDVDGNGGVGSKESIWLLAASLHHGTINLLGNDSGRDWLAPAYQPPQSMEVEWNSSRTSLKGKSLAFLFEFPEPNVIRVGNEDFGPTSGWVRPDDVSPKFVLHRRRAGHPQEQWLPWEPIRLIASEPILARSWAGELKVLQGDTEVDAGWSFEDIGPSLEHRRRGRKWPSTRTALPAVKGARETVGDYAAVGQLPWGTAGPIEVVMGKGVSDMAGNRVERWSIPLTIAKVGPPQLGGVDFFDPSVLYWGAGRATATCGASGAQSCAQIGPFRRHLSAPAGMAVRLRVNGEAELHFDYRTYVASNNLRHPLYLNLIADGEMHTQYLGGGMGDYRQLCGQKESCEENFSNPPAAGLELLGDRVFASEWKHAQMILPAGVKASDEIAVMVKGATLEYWDAGHVHAMAALAGEPYKPSEMDMILIVRDLRLAKPFGANECVPPESP